MIAQYFYPYPVSTVKVIDSEGDKQIGAARRARLFSLLLIGNNATQPFARLHNGTGTGDPSWVRIGGNANGTLLWNFDRGILFPDGIFYQNDVGPADLDVVIVYANE